MAKGVMWIQDDIMMNTAGGLLPPCPPCSP